MGLFCRVGGLTVDAGFLSRGVFAVGYLWGSLVNHQPRGFAGSHPVFERLAWRVFQECAGLKEVRRSFGRQLHWRTPEEVLASREEGKK